MVHIPQKSLFALLFRLLFSQAYHIEDKVGHPLARIAERVLKLTNLVHRLKHGSILPIVLGKDIAYSHLGLCVQHLLERDAHSILHLITHRHHQALIETLELKEVTVYHIHVTTVLLD